jgi:transcriptional regulator with XRE-family HTH domain/tetratricopeptide (TPR) repeat protein
MFRTMTSPADDPSYGVLLRGYRVEQGFSQEDLAYAAGVGVRTVRNLEAGRVLPQRQTAELIAKALSLPDAQHRRLLSSIRARRQSRLPVAQPQRSMPDDVLDFVGRQDELDWLAAEIDHSPARNGPHLVIVSGQPGVGKTSLVLHATNRLAHQLDARVAFVNLRAYDGSPLSTTDALSDLLTAFGVRPEYMPASPEARAAVYRIVTAEGSGLLILDNVNDAQQVRALLPTSPDWHVFMSSRRTLRGLTDACQIHLEEPSHEAALDMLRRIIGSAQIATEESAANELIELCGRLPLAIRVAGNRLTSHPQLTIGSLTEQMRQEYRRLDLLHAGDVSVRSAVSISYQQLSANQQRLLRLAAAVPWPSVSAVEAAALCAVPVAVARDMLDDLTDAGLLTAAAGKDRYLMHDLVRLFAKEQPDEGLESALDWLADWLSAAAAAAAARLRPRPANSLQPDSVVDIADPLSPSFDDRAAIAWLDAEQVTWSWSFDRLSDVGEHHRLVRRITDIFWYVSRRPHLPFVVDLYRSAIESASAINDRHSEGALRNYLGWILSSAQGHHEAAIAEHSAALAAVRAVGDPYQQAMTHLYLGNATMLTGDLTTASEHLDAADTCLAKPEAQRPGEPIPILVHTHLVLRGLLLRGLGRIAEALETHIAAVAMWTALTDGSLSAEFVAGRCHEMVGAEYMLLGQWQSAVHELEAAVKATTAALDAHGMTISLLALGKALSHVDAARADATLLQAVEVAADNHDVLSEIRALVALGGNQSSGDSGRTEAWRRALNLCAGLPSELVSDIAESLRTDLELESRLGERLD